MPVSALQQLWLGACPVTWRLAAAEGSSWAAAAGFALATDGGVVAAPGFFPKNEAMSRCFILPAELSGELKAALLSLKLIWLSKSLLALLSVLSAVNIN